MTPATTASAAVTQASHRSRVDDDDRGEHSRTSHCVHASQPKYAEARKRDRAGVGDRAGDVLNLPLPTWSSQCSSACAAATSRNPAASGRTPGRRT